MKTKTPKRLFLKKETVIILQRDDLDNLVGGNSTNGFHSEYNKMGKNLCGPTVSWRPEDV